MNSNSRLVTVPVPGVADQQTPLALIMVEVHQLFESCIGQPGGVANCILIPFTQAQPEVISLKFELSCAVEHRSYEDIGLQVSVEYGKFDSGNDTFRARLGVFGKQLHFPDDPIQIPYVWFTVTNAGFETQLFVFLVGVNESYDTEPQVLTLKWAPKTQTK